MKRKRMIPCYEFRLEFAKTKDWKSSTPFRISGRRNNKRTSHTKFQNQNPNPSLPRCTVQVTFEFTRLKILNLKKHTHNDKRKRNRLFTLLSTTHSFLCNKKLITKRIYKVEKYVIKRTLCLETEKLFWFRGGILFIHFFISFTRLGTSITTCITTADASYYELNNTSKDRFTHFGFGCFWWWLSATNNANQPYLFLQKNKTFPYRDYLIMGLGILPFSDS